MTTDATTYEQALAEFERLVNAHDLTYDYSDDIVAWRRGRDELDAIRALAKRLKPEDVRRIWNAMVDRNIVPTGRERFYWQEESNARR